MQAVIGGCRSCPFPCPRPGKRPPPQKPAGSSWTTPPSWGSSSVTRSIAAPTGALNCGCRAPASRRPAAWRTSTGLASITLDRRLLDAVFSLKFLAKHEHVLLVGPAGVGKSFMASALGFTAIRAGYRDLRPQLHLRHRGSRRRSPTGLTHIHPLGQGNAVYLALPGIFPPPSLPRRPKPGRVGHAPPARRRSPGPHRHPALRRHHHPRAPLTSQTSRSADF